MGRVCVLAAAAMWVATAAMFGPLQAAQAPTAAAERQANGTADAHQATVKRYCVSCHNERLKTGGLALDTLSLTDVAAGAETWEKVVRKLRTNAMPPANMPRPDAAARSAFVSYLETEIDRGAAAKPFPGRTESIHRLNRAEYHNAIRDLLPLDVDVESLLPADDMSYGFDNIAGVLKMTPSLLDRYMAAARQVSRLAIGSRDAPADGRDVQAPRRPVAGRQLRQRCRSARAAGRPSSTSSRSTPNTSIEVEPLDGRHRCAPARSQHRRRAREAVHRRRPPAPGRGRRRLRRPPDDSLEVRVPVKAGPRVVGVTFVRKSAALVESVREPFLTPHAEGGHPLAAIRRERDDRGPVRRRRGVERDAEPPADLHVPAGHSSAPRLDARGRSSRSWRAAPTGVPPTDAAARGARRLLHRRTRQRQLRSRHRARAAAAARQPRVPVPGRARSAGRCAPARCIRSAISSSRRACRSSSGAASRTTRCSMRRRRAR